LLPYLLVSTAFLLIFVGKLNYGFAIDKNLRFNSGASQVGDIPFLLPFTNEIGSSTKSIPPLTNTGILDPKTQMNFPSQSQNTRSLAPLASTACTGGNLDDTFNTVYTLNEGQTSPNGKWKNVYNGFGSSGVEVADGSHVFFLKPGISNSSDETEAALVRSTGSFCDFVVDFDTKTVKQLRQNSPPNAWEAGWFIFRYTDTFHYYWFLVKPNGIELGKKDCDTCTDSVDGQQFLVTKDFPTLHLNKWSHWKISAIGNHIQIFVDGTKVIDYIDKTMSPKLSAGNIAMYSEDAYARYDNMHLRSQ
jgi:hypothetical protein